MPEPTPLAADGARLRGARWLWPAVALLAGVVITVTWVRADRFLDREEAQHALRALETERAAFGGAAIGPSLTRLLVARMDQSKPWYGWPYYLAVATIWRVTGDSADVAAFANLLFLAVAVLCCGLLAARLMGAGAGPPAALFLATTPGALLWAHFVSPTVFLLAAVAAASCCIAMTDGWSRPLVSWSGGMLASLATVAKVSLLPMWLVAAALVTARAARRGRLRWRDIRWRGLALFALGLVPAVVHVVRNRRVLAFWGAQNAAIYAEPSWRSVAVGVARRLLDALLVPHLLLALAAALFGLWHPRLRPLTAALLLWAAAPALTAVLLVRNSSTSRDYVAAALPLALLFGAAVAAAPRRVGQAVSLALIVLLPALAVVGFFAKGLRPEATHGWLGTVVDGAPGGIRHEPYADLVAPTIDALREAVPPATPSRCGCLAVRPSPVDGPAGQPAVTFDSRLVGPENVTAAFALAHRPLPWRVGFVPYPLSCGAYRTALACVDAIVAAPGALAGDIPGRSSSIDPRRGRLQDWGALARRLDLGRLGTLEIRVPTTASLCPAGNARRTAILARRIARSCPADDYYARYLLAELTPAGDDAAAVDEARRLADSRERDLRAGVDSSALLFGEATLARATRDALGARRGARPRRSRSAFDSTASRP